LIYTRYLSALRNFAGYMGIPSRNTEDVVQNVFLTLINNVHSYDVHRGSAVSFLYGITRNQTLRWLRENRNFKAMEMETEHSDHNPYVDYLKAEEIAKLRDAIRELPEAYKEAIVLCDIHELSYEEAASVLGCAIGTIRSRLNRGRSILAKYLRQGNGVSDYELSTLESNSL
ncbi:MAG TPA: RNA polymerase sigma factor, partial [Acidobacteriota bacterium]|nr:RNA polymerase sigma factor [Acidobacteriota bacterium]